MIYFLPLLHCLLQKGLILNKFLVYYGGGSLNNLYPSDSYKALLGIKKFLEEKKIFLSLKTVQKSC